MFKSEENAEEESKVLSKDHVARPVSPVPKFESELRNTLQRWQRIWTDLKKRV